MSTQNEREQESRGTVSAERVRQHELQCNLNYIREWPKINFLAILIRNMLDTIKWDKLYIIKKC